MGGLRFVYSAGFIIGYTCATMGGYGDPSSTYPAYPNWQERAIHVLTNACRMAPQAFRDAYVGNGSILLPSNYPAVAPVYWNEDLNRVARLHATDMAKNCGMSHTSCDGTGPFTRIKRYYTKSNTLAENIAYGHANPLSTVVQWLLDGSRSNPAPDRSGGDGHRRNIMNGSYRELGVGFDTGPQGWPSDNPNPYWVQDFGGGQSAFTYHPIAAASHCFIESGKTTFLMNYYDAGGGEPTNIEVVVAGVRHDLSLTLGTASTGTYMVSMPIGHECRSYFFVATDGGGDEWRYPEDGFLVGYGEGGCEQGYAGPNATGGEGGRFEPSISVPRGEKPIFGLR
ncbi:MAG: hypothetical protein GF344_14115, partial [Chitinivibrionales bacterium]|nr:hypothetical protein [Chitinivibrionales bacterium]MBD3357861.1 hypothetical protein [Chitinivibrionales bacterium]